MTDPVSVDLTDQERSLLVSGLIEWGGSAHPDDRIARAIGFNDLDDMDANQERLRTALMAKEPLIAVDWRRVLISAEIAFASDVYGSGWDWETTTGWDDETTIPVAARGSAQAHRGGTIGLAGWGCAWRLLGRRQLRHSRCSAMGHLRVNEAMPSCRAIRPP